MVINALRNVVSRLGGRSEVTNSRPLQLPPSVVNKRLYRRPPANTPLLVVPNTRNGIRELATVVNNFSRQVATDTRSKDEYIDNMQNQLAEIRKLTFWDNLGILTRRLIDFRAYAGIKAWEEFKGSASKLFVLEPDSYFFDINPEYPSMHIAYLLDDVDGRKRIPEQSQFHKYLDNAWDEDIAKCNRKLQGAFIKALDFLKVTSIAPLCYPGVVVPGIAIADTQGAQMTTGGYLGIAVDYKEVEDLLSSVKEGSDEKMNDQVRSLESNFVFMLTHILQNTPDTNLKPDGSVVCENKLAPYIAKFLYEATNGYSLAPEYRFPFDFVQGEGTQEVILAMKTLYSELKNNEKVQELCEPPKDFRPTTLIRTIQQLRSTEEGNQVLEKLTQKMLGAFSHDLFKSASKISDPEIKTLREVSFENGVIEVVSDGFLTSNAVITLSLPEEGGAVSRNIRLNRDIARALDDTSSENHATAKKVFDFAVSLAKKAPVNILRDCGHKVDVFEYGSRIIQDKLNSELEISQTPNNTLQGLKERIDSMMKENKFHDVFELAKSIGMLTNLDETLICWDYNSEPSVQRMYI